MLPTRERLAAACSGRTLDLGCGPLPLPGAIGLDLARGGAVHGDMRALPFADACFDTVASHLGFDIVGDLDPVMAEVRRVLRPGGRVVAIVGGGPVADPAPGDALVTLARDIEAAHVSIPRGDKRARDERAWRRWFRDVQAERIEVALAGPRDDVWPVLTYLARVDMPPPRIDYLQARAVFWLIRCAGSA